MSSLRACFPAALVASALWICGCSATTTTRIPATELPELLRQRMSAPSSWPKVRTVDGSTEQLTGSITHISIEEDVHREEPSERIPVPNFAHIKNGWLNIEYEPSIIAHSFRVSDLAAIVVEYKYTDKRKTSRSIAGGLLMGLAAPGFVTGAYFLGQSGQTDYGPAVGGLRLIGGFLLGVGVSTLVPGIYLVATDPQRETLDTARFRPTLQLLPGGASISTTF